MSDLKKGLYRPIDEYSEGKTQPKSVRIQRDPYYRAEESIKAEIDRKRLEEEKKRKMFKKQTKLNAIIANRKKEILFEATTPEDDAVFGKPFPGEFAKTHKKTIVKHDPSKDLLPSLRKRRQKNH